MEEFMMMTMAQAGLRISTLEKGAADVRSLIGEHILQPGPPAAPTSAVSLALLTSRLLQLEVASIRQAEAFGRLEEQQLEATGLALLTASAFLSGACPSHRKKCTGGLRLACASAFLRIGKWVGGEDHA